MPPLMMWTVASPPGGATPIMPITRTGMLTSVVDPRWSHVPSATSKTEIGEARMVCRSRACWIPVKLALALADGQVVDRGVAPPHKAVFVEFPILVAVGPEPVIRIVAPFIGEPDADSIALPGPQLLDQPIVQLLGPLARQKRDDLLAPVQELGAIAPIAVHGIGKCHALGIARIPSIFGTAYLQDGGVARERRQWRARVGHLRLHRRQPAAAISMARRYMVIAASGVFEPACA